MNLRLVTFDELPADLGPQRALLHLSAFGGYWDDSEVARARGPGGPLADYVAVFALARNRVAAQTFVHRIPFTTPRGTEIVSGMDAVVSLPDATRRGFARAVLNDVHRRERKAGIRYSLLWTSRSWYAHDLYESLGYRDVYGVPRAARFDPPARLLPKGWSVRRGGTKDLSALSLLHEAVSRGRYGFTPRISSYFQGKSPTRRLPMNSHLLLEREGQLEAYAGLEESPDRLDSRELLAQSPASAAVLLQALELRSPGRLLTIGHSFVADQERMLRRRGYGILPSDWNTLMAARLGSKVAARDLAKQLGIADPRFICLAGDRF